MCAERLYAVFPAVALLPSNSARPGHLPLCPPLIRNPETHYTLFLLS